MALRVYDPTNPGPFGIDDRWEDTIEIKVWRDNSVGLSVCDSCWDAAYLNVTTAEMRLLAERLLTVADAVERAEARPLAIISE